MPRMRRIGCLHERIHQRGQEGRGAENQEQGDHKEHYNQRNKPPLLLLAKKKEKLFNQLGITSSNHNRNGCVLAKKNGTAHWYAYCSAATECVCIGAIS